jgi:hypothetical protein
MTVLFLVVLGFQVGVLGDTLDSKSIARLANLLSLSIFVVLAFIAIGRRHRTIVFLAYILPPVLVLLGVGVNLLRSGLVDNLGYLGMTIPWWAALAVPFATPNLADHYWRWFFRFMLIASVVAVLEYVAVFAGLIPLTLIETDRSEFLKGYVTIFHDLGDRTAYGRLYGIFPEPGTFAMYLLCAMAYCLIERRGTALSVFALALFLTGSMGGVVGLGMLLIGLGVAGGRRVSASRMVIVGLAIASMMVFAGKPLGGLMSDWYDAKGLSAEVREENVVQFLVRLPVLVVESPFGLRVSGSSLSSLRGQDSYIGSNFALATWFALGGVIALWGYVAFLATNCIAIVLLWLGPRRGTAERAAALSLPVVITFIVQRATPLDTAVYAFLFGGVIVATLKRIRT